MIKFKKMFVTVLLIIFFLSTKSAYSLLSGWNYCTDVDVYNGSGKLTDYQLQITLTPINFDYTRCKPDGSDIRFVDSDDTTQLNYWVENWSTNGISVFWVKVPDLLAGTTETIHIYYGNPSAEAVSNGNNTFQFFEDFNQTGKTYENIGTGSGSYTIQDSVLTMTEISSGTGVDFALQLTDSFNVFGDGTQEVRAKVKITALREIHGIIFSSGTAGIDDTSSTYKFAGTQDLGITVDSPYYWGKHFKDWFKDWNIISFLLDDFSGTRPISVSENDDTYCSADQQFDWIFVRKYSSIAPTVTVKTQPRGFTLIVLPDTQDYSNRLRSYNIFTKQTQWIVDNKNFLNIAFLVQVGDITDGTMTAVEWKHADKGMGILDNNIPYLVIPGNHDYSGVKDRETALKNYNKYFGPDRFSGYSYYGGHYPDNGNQNNYGFFSTPDFDFLVIGLEFGATDEDLAWAESIINKYPNKKVILFMHAYMYNDNTRISTKDSWSPEKYPWPGSNNGDKIFEKLVQKHSNIMFVLSGHILNSGVGRMIDMVDGYPIFQILQNYQIGAGGRNGGKGFLRYYMIIPSQNKAFAKSYSPLSLGRYLTNPTNDFELDLTTPTNPTTCNAWDSLKKKIKLESDIWQTKINKPYFEWAGAASSGSGVKGYSVYLGTDSNGNSGIAAIQSVNNYKVARELATDNTYYLRVRTIDNANNWSQPATLFVFKYQKPKKK